MLEFHSGASAVLEEKLLHPATRALQEIGIDEVLQNDKAIGIEASYRSRRQAHDELQHILADSLQERWPRASS